jgi:hypothetical protein
MSKQENEYWKPYSGKNMNSTMGESRKRKRMREIKRER